MTKKLIMNAPLSRRVALKAVVITCVGSMLTSESSAFTAPHNFEQRVRPSLSSSSDVFANRISQSLPQIGDTCGPLHVSTIGTEEAARRRTPADSFNPFLQQQQRGADVGGLIKVASAALLITGNTVGAGTMVLPEVAAGPGLGVSTILFVGVYLINLLSGMLIAEVAIKQYETTGDQVPSSFKEFADANLRNPTLATAVSATSVFVNWCVMSFAIMKAANLVSDHVDIQGMLNGVGLLDMAGACPPTAVAAAGFVTALTSLVVAQDAEKLSMIASMCVMVLFGSFASILMPGLANVETGFLTTMSLPGLSSGDMLDAVSSAAPVFLMTLGFQNIVPSVTKLLDYDRTRSIAAIVMGSSLPLMMYVAWCYGVLGGGIDLNVIGFAANDASSAATQALLTVFTVASVCGSSIAGSLSLVRELENFVSPSKLGKTEVDDASGGSKGASLASMLLAVVPPLMAGVCFGEGENFTKALSCAGSFGSPLLYGIIPAAMAWTQRNRAIEQQGSLRMNEVETEDIVPGGAASLAFLGLASVGFVGQEAVASVTQLMN